jgi:hypothetical protein
MSKKLPGAHFYTGLMTAWIILCMPQVETSAQTLQKGSVLPALIWSDNSVKRNVTVINAVGDSVILRVDGKIVNLKRNAFIKIYKNTQANLDKIKVDTSAPPPTPPTKKVIPKPEQFTVGHAISELIWRDGGLKKNVEVINVIRGYHILRINGKSETVGSKEFQQLLKATSEHPESGTPIPVAKANEPPPPATTPIPTPENKPTQPSVVSTQPQQPVQIGMNTPVAPATPTPNPTPDPPNPSPEPVPSQPPMDGTSLGDSPEKPIKEIETDEEVSFRFIFDGDTEPPTVGGIPTPPKAENVKTENTVAAKPIDTSNWRHYEDDKPKEEKAREAIPLGLQFQKLMEMIGGGWNWFLSNIVWTGPVTGILFIGSLGLLILGKVKKSKQQKIIQAQIGERKANKTATGTNPPKRKQGGKFKKFKQATTPVTRQPSEGNHLYLCFTAHDHEAALGLQEHLEDHGFEVRCRDLINGSGKIFDNDVVDAIETAQAVIFTASGNAYASERVKMEIDLARDENKKIVPVYLDDTELPELFMDFENESMFVYFDPADPDGSLEEIVAYIRMKGIKPSAVIA